MHYIFDNTWHHQHTIHMVANVMRYADGDTNSRAFKKWYEIRDSKLFLVANHTERSQSIRTWLRKNNIQVYRWWAHRTKEVIFIRFYYQKDALAFKLAFG